MSPRAVDKRARPGNEGHQTPGASPTEATAALDEAGTPDPSPPEEPAETPPDN